MKQLVVLAMGLSLALLATSCASTKVTSRDNQVSDEQLPKPNRIIVHNFASTPDDIPADAAIIGHYERRETPQTPQEVKLGRQLGAQVAQELVSELRKLGLPAELASMGLVPQENDVLLRGEFVTLDPGSRLKRMTIGFGAGAGGFQTHVEAYQITAGVPRHLGKGQVNTTGGKMPGILVPVGGGAALGSAATSAVVSGTLNVGQEVGPENLRTMAKKTAQAIIKDVSPRMAELGWIPPAKAK